MKRYEIYSLKDEHGLCSVKTSAAECEIVLYNLFQNPNVQIQSAFTSQKPPMFGRIRPDIYLPELKTMVWVHSCVFHDHKTEDGCLQRNQEWTSNGTRNCW